MQPGEEEQTTDNAVGLGFEFNIKVYSTLFILFDFAAFKTSLGLITGLKMGLGLITELNVFLLGIVFTSPLELVFEQDIVPYLFMCI